MACVADLPQALSKNGGPESAALETCPGPAPEDNLLHMPANSLSPSGPRGTKLLALTKAASVWSGHSKAKPEGFMFSERMDWTFGRAAPLLLLPLELPASLFPGQHRSEETPPSPSHVMQQEVCYFCSIWTSDKLLKAQVWLTARSVTLLLFTWPCFPFCFPLLFFFIPGRGAFESPENKCKVDF